MPPTRMNLKVLLPFQVFAEKTGVSRIVAETRAGSFGLLPHRLDCVAALAPGILTYETEAEGEVYVAVDDGVLVKTGLDVLVSVRRALGGTDLGQLRDSVEKEFMTLDEREKSVRSVDGEAGGWIPAPPREPFNMSDEDRATRTPSKSGPTFAEQVGAKAARKLKAQRNPTASLVRPGHDGAHRLVGGDSDPARRGAGSLAGHTARG